MRKFQPIIGLLAILLLATQTPARAEVGRLPAASPYPTEREVFYEDGDLTAQDFLLICNFLGEKPEKVPSLAPECAGYLRAVIGLFHSGEITQMMAPSQCYNLMEEIPDWSTAIIKSLIKHGNDTKGEELRKQSLYSFVIKSVVKDYPCQEKGAEGNTKGIKAR